MNCPGWLPTKFPRFCTLHFDKNDIMDGTNCKLQYQAVPVYFNDTLKIKTEPKKQKISALIRKMNQNQLLYSSDSECEYQIIVRVHKKPRRRNNGAPQIRCVHCNMKKDSAEELAAHHATVHGLELTLFASADVREMGDQVYEFLQEGETFMCSDCGLIFMTPAEVVNHAETSHYTRATEENVVIYEEIGVEQSEAPMMVEEEYVLEDAASPEDVKPYVKQEYHEEEYVEEPLIEENLRTTFKCKLCNIDFMSKDEIKQHISTVHNAPQSSHKTLITTLKKEEPVEEVAAESDNDPETYEPQCYICDAAFTTLARMRKHIRIAHKTEEYYYCSHCTGTFMSLDMYEDHECLIEEEILQ